MKPPSCRFYPSCSSYAIEAVHTHGAGRGTLLAAWRILRCGPWHPGGYDPVPERFPSKDLDRTKEGNTTCED